MSDEQDLSRLQKKIIEDANGHFVPYIGEEYSNGLGIKLRKNPKVLIIGPRHYCDAKYSSRNVLAYMTEEMRDNLKEGEPFPSHIKVGCVEITARHCLKDKHDSCPVYLNNSHIICPLKSTCKIFPKNARLGKIGYEDSLCHGHRNLRCETLYAINEYLKIPKIESLRLGMTYFDTITRYLIDEFKLFFATKNVAEIKQNIWRHVAFTNLIQRFIPLKGVNSESNKIGANIKESDRIFCEDTIIKQLVPDFIILTMNCVKQHLTTVLNRNNYVLHRSNKSLDYYIFKRNSINVESLQNKWEVMCKQLWSSYKFPSSSIELGTDIYNFIAEFAESEYMDSLPKKSIKKELRKVIVQCIKERLDVRNRTIPYLEHLKCFNQALGIDKSEEVSRKWIDNAYRHSNRLYETSSILKIKTMIESVK